MREIAIGIIVKIDATIVDYNEGTKTVKLKIKGLQEDNHTPTEKYIRMRYVDCEEKMEIQYRDDISNPLEPLKLSAALESELFKYNYRKEHKPQDINMLDFTVIYALKHCLEEVLKESEA